MIRGRFLALTDGLDTHTAYKAFATAPTDNGVAHAEQNGDTYAYVMTERGQDLERRETRDPDELLYWFVSDAAADAARRYEGRHRQSGVDTRRLYFRTHVELLARLRPDWGERRQKEYDLVLQRHPFVDGA